jgi:hypothetical protein
MTTLASGRLGGQYILRCVTDDIYSVAGLSHGDFRQFWKGEYERATKLMDYCASHDGEAQTALHALYFEADPEPLTTLLDKAWADQEAKPRRRVHVWVRVVTDVLESENAIENVTQRVSQAAGLAGLVITQLECFYADVGEKFVAPYIDGPQPPKEELTDSGCALRGGGETWADGVARVQGQGQMNQPTDRDEPTGSSFVQS